ncbi:MAG: hypothetical protein IJ176_05535 [Prevotella sp.]|nr:hypothetical protein [Prevotella sp.]
MDEEASSKRKMRPAKLFSSLENNKPRHGNIFSSLENNKLRLGFSSSGRLI